MDISSVRTPMFEVSNQFHLFHSPASVSGSNLTIPLRYESENNAKTLESRKNRRESNEVWQVIDLGERAKSVPSTIAGSDSRTEGVLN